MSRGGAGCNGRGGKGLRGSLGGDFWVENSVGMTLTLVGLEGGMLDFCSSAPRLGDESRVSGEGDRCTDGYAGGGRGGGEASLCTEG